MNNILKEIKDVSSELCVTIVLNTHRTLPSNEKDALLLKNLQKEAIKRLHQEPNQKLAILLIDKLDLLVSSIDSRYNTESLALFVSKDISRYARLPIAVVDRVVIDTTFATRDLVRAQHLQQAYYTLVLGQDRARLIEAADGRVVEELGRPFPMINTTLFAANRTEAFDSKKVSNYQREFFNRVDKALWAIWLEHPLPLIIAADEKCIAYFKEVSEHAQIIIGSHNDSYDRSAQHIVDNNWYLMQQYALHKNEERISELAQGMNTGNVLTDLNDIWTAIQGGRGKTLFVQTDYHQPATIVEGKITPVELNDMTTLGVIDDIVDELIELNAKFGGDVVFLPHGSLDPFKEIALTTRY